MKHLKPMMIFALVGGFWLLGNAQTLRLYSKTHGMIDYEISDVDSVVVLGVSSVQGSSSSSQTQNSSTSSSSLSSAQTSSSSEFLGTLTDARDGQKYKTVLIAGREWMAQNLNYGTMQIDASGLLLSSGQKFCYKNLTANCDTAGGLYQWHTAMNLPSTCAGTSCSAQISSAKHQGICPTGWHMPTSAEWASVDSALGGAAQSGKAMKLNKTSASTWNVAEHNDGNSSGFGAYPAGCRYMTTGFVNLGANAYFWEAKDSVATLARFHILAYDKPSNVSSFDSRKYGFSVRCVRD